MHKRTGPRKSIAYRRAGTVMAVAATIALGPLHAGNAFAFKLFGMTLWGEDDTTDQVSDPVHYTVDFKTDNLDKDLKEALTDSSMLVSDKKKPVSGDLGVVIKARDDRDRLIATLYEKARYGGVVTITVNGTDIDALSPNPTFGRSKPVAVTISVDPGPVFTLGKIKLLGDARGLDPAGYGLVPGGDAGSLTILKAGDKIVVDFKNQGHPLAKLIKRDVVADHETNRVDVALSVESGPMAPIGNVGVSGQKSVDPDFIKRYARINEGKPYSPDELKKASDRLRKLGVFSSVTIREADKLAPDGSIPMTIEVAEGKQRYFGVGAQYSTIDGFGVQGYWGHRNLTGRADSLRIEGSVSRIGETTDVGQLDYSAGITYVRPATWYPSATFTAGLKMQSLHPDAYDADTITASGSLAYELSDQDTVSGGGEISYEQDSTDAYGDQNYLTLAIPLEYVRDTRDNKLDPTAGYRASISAKPSYEAIGGGVFSSFEGSISGYQGVGANDNVVFAGKLSLGSLIGSNSIEDIPATRRFYAGGGGSVRGYAYQEITPYNSNGDALGGRSYATASLEARIKITDTIGIVPFVDMGSVTDSTFPDFSDLRIGAGVGVRYATPFGPIRLDVAVPLKKYENGTAYGIYAGIGQAF
ncbi:autotransporter assembly complex protein TamA [Rhizobium sp. CNPSo 3464]|uniref:autotransporter assembly complex protein TamA n=1 Tax=Rhizobium sp. CNPSo 3464 TaxID=3021406 RepID=UPI00254DE8A4|nr:autotransporter assembly complex family protein [Rhizobium sp. CNPSo 3464]MDK4739782.1 autotransporter assembly complex protein TamA [Rhizobium sp. CNPSo 3464]